MRKLLGSLFSIAALGFSANAQEVNISTVDDYESCVGALVDSGQSAADYGANENQSITWCPEAPETILNLYWVVFDLDAASTITIYDGDSNAAPVIGTYTGDELQAQDITSTNATGCLTVEFTSGPNSSGNFGAFASCGEPCEKPFAVVNPFESEMQPVRACIGEEFILNGSYSTVAEGQEIVTWEWNLGDGTSDDSGDVITHIYNQPGLYVVNLDITDSNDCENQNIIDYQVLVSTNPVFDGTSSGFSMCVGDTADISGMVQGVQYTAEPSVDFGDGLFIPDDQSQCFSSELTFSSFSPGAEVVNANADIVNLFINFEHSYMGDLTITFICPSGQTLLVHQQGGGGTFLGVPVDVDTDPDNPGVGWDYFWEPGATNGTWADNAGGTLPTGAYESVQPFTNLNGCPLNGTWEVEVCDLWGSDNGFIFDWSIEFAPDLYPEAVSFTPIFGEECDSTYWIGSNILEYSDNSYDGDCDDVSINPLNVGTEVYTYNAINDFGCHYEVPINVEVMGVTALISADPFQFCGEPIVLNADLIGAGSDDCDFEWSWTPTGGVTVDNSNTLTPTITQMDNITLFTLDVEYDIPNNANVCTSSFNIEIETCEITIPNIFTPNSDLKNDVWTVDGLAGFNNSEVYIYDRWGVELYSEVIDYNDTDPTWDGTIQSPVLGEVEASPGVYYYVIKVHHGEDELIAIDQNCECEDGTIDVDCCCPCENSTEFNLDCCPNSSFMNQDGWTTYTGTISLYR